MNYAVNKAYTRLKKSKLTYFLGLTGLLLLSSNCSYKTYTTAGSTEITKTSTVIQKLKSEQVDGEAGVQIGNYMDQQLAGYSTIENVVINRESQGLHMIINSRSFFDASSHTLKDDGKSTCRELHAIFKKSPNTKMLLEVHTDDIGSRYYNQGLSERRTNSIAEYLSSIGASTENITFKSYGEDQPLTDPSFSYGRDSNRRIEIAIYAGSQLKELAQSGKTL